MAKDPEKRFGFKNNECAELKSQPFFKEINWNRLEAGEWCLNIRKTLINSSENTHKSLKQ